MRKNILVTGCAGFIGSAISKKLIDNKYNVFGIDNLSTGKKKNIPKNLKFVVGSCNDQKTLNKFKNINFFSIIHLAGKVGSEISSYNPLMDCENNILATLKLLELAKKTRCNHFIYASSMSVYGDLAAKPVSENHNCNPKSYYGISKLASENYIKISQNKKLKSTILRLFTVYGPGQNLDNPMQGMISIYLHQIMKNKKLIIKGSDKRVRDFIYIDDLTNFFMKIIGNKKFFNQTLNVGTRKKYTIKVDIKKLKIITKINFPVIFKKSTPLDQFYIFPNIKKLKKFINVKSFKSLDEGLNRLVFYLKKIYD